MLIFRLIVLRSCRVDDRCKRRLTTDKGDLNRKISEWKNEKKKDKKEEERTCCWNIWFWSCWSCWSCVSFICCSSSSWGLYEAWAELGEEDEVEGGVLVVVCCWLRMVFSRPCICSRLLRRLIASWFWLTDMGGEGGGGETRSLSMRNNCSRLFPVILFRPQNDT